MRDTKKLDQKILRILVPAILENAFLILSDMILTGYIGRLSVTEISAYGISTRVYGIYFSILKGFAIGTMVIFARAFGAGKRKEGLNYYFQALFIAFPVALVAAVLIWVFPQPLLSTMSSDSTLLTYGASFLRIHVLTYPFLAIIHLNSSMFQADGNTKTPLYIATIGNLVSMVLGYVLILGIGPIQGMGLQGAAITNNLRIIVMLLVGVYLLFNRNSVYRSHELSEFNSDMKTIKDLIRFGVPTAIGNSFWNFAAVFLSTYILSYGQQFYAAYQIGLQAEGFCDMMSSGFLTAAMSLSSLAIGAKDADMFKASYKRLNYYCYIICGINMLFLLLFSKNVLHLLTDKMELIDIAHVYLLSMIASQFPQMKSKIEYGYIRSIGFSTLPTIIDMVGIWGVRVFGCYLVSSVFHLDIFWIWMIVNADQWVRYLLSAGVIISKKVLRYLDQPHFSFQCEGQVNACK